MSDFERVISLAGRQWSVAYWRMPLGPRLYRKD